MNREQAHKLLGGYATGTLTDAEREALFSAALEDQELFDAIMKEEALREVLEDPVSKARILAALEHPPPRPAWWRWRPLVGALAMAGIALAIVAVWRGTRDQPAPVMVAEVRKQPAPPLPSAAVIEAAPPPSATPKRQANVPKKPGTTLATDRLAENTRLAKDAAPAEPKQEEPNRRELKASADAAAIQAPVSKGDVQVGASGGQVQAAPAAPSPASQQQALAPALETITGQAVPALNRAAAISGFRAAEKKAAPLLQWSILRGDREAPPETVLDANETVRLRVVSQQPGILALTEGDKVLVSAPVTAGQPFDTPPIPFTAAGPRQLRLRLVSGAARPVDLAITLNYTP